MKLSTITNLISPILGLTDGTAPTGSYSGSKTVLGESVALTMSVADETHVNFVISGVASLTCNAEAFHIDGSNLILEGIDASGDCIHDNLTENHVDFKSFVYDTAADTLTATAKYLRITTIELVLSKSGLTSDSTDVNDESCNYYKSLCEDRCGWNNCYELDDGSEMWCCDRSTAETTFLRGSIA